MSRYDNLLLERAYTSIYESKSILIPRRSKEERAKNWQIVLQKQITDYIKGGSKGSLYLNNTNIQYLPDNLEVGGSLDLYNTPIQSLPDNLRVGDHLNLNNTPIQSLPDNLTVGGSLYLYNTNISKKYSADEIKGMVEYVGGRVIT